MRLPLFAVLLVLAINSAPAFASSDQQKADRFRRDALAEFADGKQHPAKLERRRFQAMVLICHALRLTPKDPKLLKDLDAFEPGPSIPAGDRYRYFLRLTLQGPNLPAAQLELAKAALVQAQAAPNSKLRGVAIVQSLAAAKAADTIDAAVSASEETRTWARQQVYGVDWNIFSVGGGLHEGRLALFPVRFLWPKPGLALVLHPLLLDFRDTAQVTGVGPAGVANGWSLLSIEPLALELRQRLWQASSLKPYGAWAPFYGPGVSFSAFALTVPRTIAMPMGSRTGDGAETIFNAFGSQPYTDGQDYQVGLRLDAGPLGIALGYAWTWSDSTRWSDLHQQSLNFAATSWDGVIARAELSIF